MQWNVFHASGRNNVTSMAALSLSLFDCSLWPTSCASLLCSMAGRLFTVFTTFSPCDSFRQCTWCTRCGWHKKQEISGAFLRTCGAFAGPTCSRGDWRPTWTPVDIYASGSLLGRGTSGWPWITGCTWSSTCWFALPRPCCTNAKWKAKKWVAQRWICRTCLWNL